MTATPVRPNVRFARFILQKNVASRRYLHTFWNPKTLGGKGAIKPGATQADVKKHADVVAANEGNTRILFRSKANMGQGDEDVVYITDDPLIASYLRAEIRSGRLKAREDVTVAPLSCPWCAFTLNSSTPKDQELMYHHHLDEHPEKLDEMVGSTLDYPVFEGSALVPAGSDELTS
jgi:glutaredoxin